MIYLRLIEIKNILFSIGIIYFSFSLSFSSTKADPSTPNAYALGGANSILNHQELGAINPFIGQAVYHVRLDSNVCKSGFKNSVDLDYSSLQMDLKVSSNNENVPLSWVGVGWNLGYSYIRVVHNNTVNRNEDPWLIFQNIDSTFAPSMICTHTMKRACLGLLRSERFE